MAESTEETMRFGHLDITFDPSCLRPRPWTTAQSRWVADLLEDAPAGSLLELCTGAGHIGLLAVAGSDRRLVAVDVEPRVLELARRNADRAGLGGQVEFRCGDMAEVLDDGEVFPVVLADPPWVTSDGVADLPEDPELAIDGGADGLDVARQCVEVAEKHLMPAGSIVVQLGTTEQADVLGAWAADRGRLEAGEVRAYDGGVLLRLVRRER